MTVSEDMTRRSVSNLKEIPGNSGKFKNMENICKHVEKYDFCGLKKLFFLAHLLA